MKKLLILALVVLAGCYYDNEEELYPDGSGCDTTNVTFSGTILPIIEGNCFACHGTEPGQGNIFLGDYDAISAHGQIPPGQPGSLYGAVSHSQDNTPMPYQLPQLDDCQINQIWIWISDGTPNN